MESQKPQSDPEGCQQPEMIDSALSNQARDRCDQSNKENDGKTLDTQIPSVAKKRKRGKGQSTRNVKSKPSKKQAPPRKDPSLSQILGASLDEMLASNTPLPDSNDSFDGSITDPQASSSPTVGSAPSGDASERRAGRGQRKGTRLTAVKQQLADLADENVRLKNSIKLLESDIDAKNKEITRKNKSDSHQKSEIKRLTNINDNLRRELSQYKHQEKLPPTPDINEHNPVRQTEANGIPSDIQCMNDKLKRLCHQVGSLETTVHSAINGNETPFINVHHHHQRPRQRSRSDRASGDTAASYAAALD